MKALLSALITLTLVAGPTLVASAAETVGEKLDDAAITTKIKAKLTKEHPKELVSVHVDTNNGVVHLQGTVPTEADKAQAEELARSTDGVKEVTNDLQVSSTSSSSSSTSSTPSASPSSSSSSSSSPSSSSPSSSSSTSTSPSYTPSNTSPSTTSPSNTSPSTTSPSTTSPSTTPSTK